MKKANRALESKNSPLKKQAAQSCAVANQPQNEVKKSLGQGYVPLVGEFRGPEDGESSFVGESAQ